MKADTNRRFAPRAVWVLACLLTLPAAYARAAGAAQGASAREISREQAIQEVQKRYGSAVRVVRSDVIDQGGHHVYVLRLLSSNGRVWVVRVDAQSGAEVP
jgi:uncharacterized membrane protein YkoI